MFMEGIFVLLFSVFVFCIAVMDSDSGKMSPTCPANSDVLAEKWAGPRVTWRQKS